MTSFGANIVRESGYMPSFKVQGQIYHSIGSIFPNTDGSAVIKSLQSNAVEGVLITGNWKGETVFVPRIPLISSQMHLPIEFKRLQFPLQLSFATSINKSQGQTIKVVGLHLQEHCFSHGQFYVGCSRVGRESNLYMLPQLPNITRNVVYQEVLWFVLTSYFPC